jgi:SAM-dependent methyltransferase
MEKPENNKFNKDYFSTYEENPARESMYKEEIKRITLYVSSGNILDIGCGIGKFLNHFPSGKWNKYGIEISDYAIDIARKNGVEVHKEYNFKDSFFDVIVLRGSLQHLPEPFGTINICRRILKNGGLLVFLATPNSNSPYFKRFGTLPFLTPHWNILIPSDIMMSNALKNMGFEILKIQYPYLESPYARPFRDHLYFFLSFLGIKKKFPFWRSMMEIYARNRK